VRIKTSELSGAALDWAVAKALGLNPNTNPEVRRQYVGYPGFAEANGFGYPIKNYGSDWSQGGPIIEEKEIYVVPSGGGSTKWKAWFWVSETQNFTPDQYGPTPLIAATRCYVASELGDKVEVPDELLRN
jgi:hypothetical protein